VPSALPAALASVALLAATAATAAAERAPWEKEERTSTVLHRSVRRVVVDLEAGSVVLRHDRTALVETDSTWFMTKPEVSVSLSNGVLTVSNHCRDFVKAPAVHVGDPLGSCRTDVVITLAGLPRGVTAGTRDGAVTVTGVRGPVSLSSGYGDVTAHQVRGPVRLAAADGDAELSDVVGSGVQVSSAMGDSRLNKVRSSRPVVVRAATGDVSLAALVAPSVQASSSSGTVQLVDVRTPRLTLHAENGPAVLNDSRVGTARVLSDADVAHVEGAVFQSLEVSGSGGVLVSTPRRFRSLQITTSDGNADATVPAGRYSLALSSATGSISLRGVEPDRRSGSSISIGADKGNITLAGK
jgi:hypothetical protein